MRRRRTSWRATDGHHGVRQHQGIEQRVRCEPTWLGKGFKPSDLVGKYIAYAALVVLIVFFGVTAPSVFLALGNFETILQNSAVQCVVAIGMTFVILIGSIDLSVGSNMALVGTLTALASKLCRRRRILPCAGDRPCDWPR